MGSISNLEIDGTSLRDDKGQVIAELNGKLDNEVISAYANAFSLTADMLSTLEKLAANCISDFEQQYKESLEFNNMPTNAMTGLIAVSLPQLPEWVMNTLSLIAKAKGEKGDDT